MNKEFRREPLDTPSTIDTLGELSFVDEENLLNWLKDQADTYNLTILLAHADDGVIWGKYDQTWQLSTTDFPDHSPLLRLETLQECRMFADTAEVYLWRDEQNKWQTRLIRDDEGETITVIDEAQILWGTDSAKQSVDFTLLFDGTMQNQHAPPIPVTQLSFDADKNYRPVRLWVRHYLKKDTDKDVDLPDEYKVGLTYVAYSRLVTLDPKPEVN